MIGKTKVFTENFDAKLASQYLSASYSKQRRQRQKQIEMLHSLIGNGHYVPGAVSIAIARMPSGKTYLVNGQHTLRAIAASNTTVQLPVHEIEIKSHDELAKVYLAFDEIAVRTMSDTAEASGLPEKLGVSRGLIAAGGGAMRLVLAEFQHISKEKKIPKTILYSQLEKQFSKELLIWSDIAEACPIKSIQKRLFQNNPIIAVGLVTLKANLKLATAFWTDFASGSGNIDSPPKAFYEALREAIYVPGTARNQKAFGTASVILRNGLLLIAVTAWNQYVIGGKLDYQLLASIKDGRVPINGTKYIISPSKPIKPPPTDNAADAGGVLQQNAQITIKKLKDEWASVADILKYTGSSETAIRSHLFIGIVNKQLQYLEYGTSTSMKFYVRPWK